jgi:hypothetical protein
MATCVLGNRRLPVGGVDAPFVDLRLTFLGLGVFDFSDVVRFDEDVGLSVDERLNGALESLQVLLQGFDLFRSLC